MRQWSDIVAIIESRRAARGPALAAMIAVRDRYQADYVIPDPSGATDDPTPILTPALIAEAVDQPAMRAASVVPALFVPALNPTELTGKHSTGYARRRRAAVLASWHDSRLPLLMRRGFRQLRAYDTACFLVEPDTDTKMPMIRLRDPLTAYPEPKVPEDLTLPADCGFIHGKSGTWLRQKYPMSSTERGGPVGEPGRETGDDLWDVVEWLDEEEIVIGILGPHYQARYDRLGQTVTVSSDFELERYPNRAGCCPVVCPQTVTLDQVSSQVAKIIGHVDLQAQMLALQIAAVQRSIFPDRYVIGKGNQAPQLVSGSWKEGRTGEVNFILDADSIGELKGEPGHGAESVQDRLERNARISSSLIPQMGGESGGTVPRTGRGLDTLGSWAVDPRVQELQELMQYTLEAVNTAVLKTYVGYWPGRKYVDVFSGIGSSGEFSTFQPSKELAEDQHTKVSYAIAGADKQATTVALGQMVGAKMMSHDTARQMHPDIADGEAEGRRILEEELDEALKAGILNRTVQGGPDGISLEDASKLRDLIRQGKELDVAFLEVTNERKQAQAAEAQGVPVAPGEAPPPDVAGAGAMPGVAGPQEGVGSGALPPGVPAAGGIEGPPAPLDRLRALTGALAATSPGGG